MYGILSSAEQVICLPVGPRCGECELSDGRCPSASKAVAKTRTRKVTTSTSRGTAGPKVEIEIEEVKIEEIIVPVEDPPSPLSDIESSAGS